MSAVRPSQPLAPTLSQSGSTVTIAHPDPDVILSYTLDGSAPTINSGKYTAPFVLTQSKTVTAAAFRPVRSIPAMWNFTVALTPTQALIASFADTALLDALLVFDSPHYSTPGGAPGVLVDALGGPITYTAPNTQATPAAVQDSSGYWYASADGVDDTLIASANQTVAYYCAVFRSPPGQTVWSNYGAPIETAHVGNDNHVRLGVFNMGNTNFEGYSPPRGVQRNGVALASPCDLAPITNWQTVSISTHSSASSLVLALASIYALESSYSYYLKLHPAAIGIRYTDPTSTQQTQIESRMAPVRDALLASA